jgi:serine/threonine protein kinase/HAMP domain-containing protein
MNEEPGLDHGRDEAGAAEARAAVLTRRVAALEAALAVERRLRQVRQVVTQAPPAMPAEHGDEADLTVPLARRADDDATVPAWRHKASGPEPSVTRVHVPARPSPAGRTQHPATASPLALAPGLVLFEYRIDAVLGQGGFGITYLATDVNLNAAVAIKEYLPADYAQRASDKSVSPRWPEDRDFYQGGLDSFLVEARTLASFRHPNIVRVARFFEANRTAYMVLEYERGKPLKRWWPGREEMREADLLGLLQPLLDGLAAVHAAGYLHRDIKPDNIYVRKADGSLVLLDFGAARLTVGTAGAQSGVVTPGYAPPEQYSDGAQGPWTDLYAMAATLYWMISGSKPPAAPARLAGAEPMVPALACGRGRYSDEFLRAIDRALELDPAARPRSVGEWAEKLYAAHAGSLALQDALRLGDADPHGADSLRDALLGTPRRIWRRTQRVGAALLHPGSWPMAVKMTLAMVLAALLPMVATAYYNLERSMAAVTASELRNLERLAQSTAGRIGQLIDDSGHLANYLAADEDFIGFLRSPGTAGKEQVRAKLAALVRTNPDVHLMILMNAEGLALESSEPGVAGRSFAFRDYFKEALQGHAYKTGIVVGATEGKPGMYYANPVFDEAHRVIGVVVMRLKGSSVSRILDEATARSGRVPFLVDGDGVLIHHPDSRHLYRSLVPLPPAALARIVADQRFLRDRVDSAHMPALARAVVGATGPGNISYRSTLSGLEEHAGFAPVPGHDWVVGVSEPRARFEQPLRKLYDNMLYSVALAGAVFLMLAVLFARSIVRPIARLTDAANALKEGDYERANIKVTANDEIGRLARTFNVMIDVLRQRERERRRGRR